MMRQRDSDGGLRWRISNRDADTEGVRWRGRDERTQIDGLTWRH